MFLFCCVDTMPSFRIQYASNLFVDLHAPKYKSLLKPVSSTLALLGNIGRPQDEKTYHFLNYCSRNWDTVAWVNGSHELSSAETKTLAKEFSNIRCLDSEEIVFPSGSSILIGLPSEKPQELPLALFRRIFWSMTNPLSSIVFLTSNSKRMKGTLMQDTRLESPMLLWLLGSSPSAKNGLWRHSDGKQFFATNSYFLDSKLTRLPLYSPTAFVDIVHPDSEVSFQEEKQSLQHA